MESVTNQPVEYKSLGKAPDPYRGNERRLATTNLEDLRREVLAQKTRIIEGIQATVLTGEEKVARAQRAERFFEFVYHVFLVPETQLSDEQKEVSARIQHHVVNNVIFAALPPTDTQFSIAVYRVVSAAEAAVAANSKKRIRTPRELWNGIKSELAVAKALAEAGYVVYLPDYAQMTKRPEEDEILQIDMLSNTDLIAIKGETAFLIDAKGKSNISQISIEPPDKGHYGITPFLRKLLQNLGVRRFYKARVTIPTKYLTFTEREFFPHPAEDYKEELKKFCLLSQEERSAIIAGLEELVSKR